MNKKTFITKTKLTIIFSIIILLLDQIVKAVAINITNGNSVEIIKGVLNFTYVSNPGGAFGIGADSTTFLLINVLVIFLLIRFMITQKDRIDVKTNTSLLLIISGGISNLIDRIFRGGVVDFIDISPAINFPKFNFADICIVIGWILFVLFAAIHTNEIIQERKKKLEKIKRDN